MRDLILGIMVFVVATSAAIASSLEMTNVYVHARITAGGPIICVNTGESCESIGATTCSVFVSATKLGQAGFQKASSYGRFNTYFPKCGMIITHSSLVPMVSSLTVYELQP